MSVPRYESRKCDICLTTLPGLLVAGCFSDSEAQAILATSSSLQAFLPGLPLQLSRDSAIPVMKASSKGARGMEETITDRPTTLPLPQI